jgi:hypothetical protein
MKHMATGGIRGKLEAGLEALISEGHAMAAAFRDAPSGFQRREALSGYQGWYTRALAVVRALVPGRVGEFVRLYRGDTPQKVEDFSPLSFGIADYLLGVMVTRTEPDPGKLGRTRTVPVFDPEEVSAAKLRQQTEILAGTRGQLVETLADLSGVLQAQMFDTELDAARELLKTGHVRAAGALSGVVVERHLSMIAASRSVSTSKPDPTISELNDALKKAGVVDLVTWRAIQRLGDIRNLCAHSKSREPTADEAQELIDGADKLVKTLL